MDWFRLNLFARMLIVASFLGGIYASVAGFFYAIGVPWWIVSLGTVVVILVQYILGVKRALQGVGADQIARDEYPEFIDSVDELASEMGIQAPALYLAQMGEPNAFAVGRRGSGHIVVSPMLLKILDRDEALAVIAHELAHLKNRDSILMVLSQSIASLVELIVEWAVTFFHGRHVRKGGLAHGSVVISTGLVYVLVFALSRYREYVADTDAVSAMGGSHHLANALAKMSGQPVGNTSVSTLCIVGPSQDWFSTHPSMEKRIQRLVDW